MKCAYYVKIIFKQLATLDSTYVGIKCLLKKINIYSCYNLIFINIFITNSYSIAVGDLFNFAYYKFIFVNKSIKFWKGVIKMFT